MFFTHWHWLKISGHVVALCNLAVTKACSQVGSVTNTDSVQRNGLKDYEIDDDLSDRSSLMKRWYFSILYLCSFFLSWPDFHSFMRFRKILWPYQKYTNFIDLQHSHHDMKDEKFMHITTQRISSHLGYRSHQLSFVFLLLCATNRNLEMLQVFVELSRDLSAS